MHFEIIGEIEEVETMAVGGSIRDIMRLQKQFSRGRWRKLKGLAKVRLHSGQIRKAELLSTFLCNMKAANTLG